MRLPDVFSPFRQPSLAERLVRRLAVDVEHALRHVHEIKEILMVTKDELKAQIGEVKTILTETQKDVDRVATKLEQAVANNDLSDVAAAVQELRTLAQNVGDRAEQADPEQPATPAEPDNPQPAGPAGPQGPNNLQV